MSERGVFAVDRGIFDHPFFNEDRPFSRLEAWLWMLAEAEWKPVRRSVGSSVISVDRGQFAHSIRFLAEAWGWPKTNVSRFLDRLKTGTMIGTDTGTGVLIVTICNYETYQKVALPKRDKNGTDTGTKVGQEWDRLENSESIEIEHTSHRDVTPDHFGEFWNAYPKREGSNPRKPAEVAFGRIVKAGVDPRQIISAAKAYSIQQRRENGTAKSRFTPMASTWLNQDRWKADEPVLPEITTKSPEQLTDEEWMRKLSYLRPRREWRENLGPPPFQPGCKVPAHLLIERDRNLEPDAR